MNCACGGGLATSSEPASQPQNPHLDVSGHWIASTKTPSLQMLWNAYLAELQQKNERCCDELPHATTTFETTIHQLPPASKTLAFLRLFACSTSTILCTAS